MKNAQGADAVRSTLAEFGSRAMRLALGVFSFVFKRGAAVPKRRREARIVRDVRPALLQSIIQLPETKRAGRIVRAQADFELPALPPDRPRTRIAERRPGPMDDASD